MKPLSTLAIVSVLAAFVLMAGCTNQPISLNRKLPTKDLLGYWQLSNANYGYYINQGRDGFASAEQLLLNPETNRYEFGSGTSGKCYFKDLKKGGKTYRFMSVGSEGKFRTFLFSFDKKKRLNLQEVSYKFIAGLHNADEDDLQHFAAPGYFSDFMMAHLGDDQLFGETEIFQRRKKPDDFSKPGL